MASVTVQAPFALSAPPTNWQKPAPTGKHSKPIELQVYPAGPSYISQARKTISKLSYSDYDALLATEAAEAAASKASNGGDDAWPGLGEEQEDPYILSIDAKEWKKQDHYAVLGLGNYRYLATQDQIVIAHRRKVLRHHPDKKATGASGSNDDNFFKCIQKSFEILTNPEKRRQWDSVDPNIEDEVPRIKDIKTEDFCKVFGPVFAREGRFSKAQPVPAFGEMDATKAEVEGFYDFWYNFDSWRSFEYNDKEGNEGTDSRDEKRFTEKKNKAERARAKKEDNTRLRELVDMVLAADPRIKRIKQEEKAARDAKKKGGVAGAAAGGAKGKPLTPAQKKAEAEKLKAEEAKKAEEEKKANEASKVDKEAAKKAKEAAKKNLKKWKKAIATVITSSNYFQAAGTSPSAAVIEKQLAELDTLVEVLEPEEVKTLKEEIEKVSGDAAKALLVKAAGVAAGKEGGAGKFSEFA